jgi:hypothetical protein
MNKEEIPNLSAVMSELAKRSAAARRKRMTKAEISAYYGRISMMRKTFGRKKKTSV